MTRTIKNLPDKLGIENSIVFVLYSNSKQEEFKFEDLAKQCFVQFPQIFSLRNYPKLLDTRKLDKSLRHLRKRGLIKGSPQTCFSLSSQGRKLGKELFQVLCQKKLL